MFYTKIKFLKKSEKFLINIFRFLNRYNLYIFKIIFKKFILRLNLLFKTFQFFHNAFPNFFRSLIFNSDMIP